MNLDICILLVGFENAWSIWMALETPADQLTGGAGERSTLQFLLLFSAPEHVTDQHDNHLNVHGTSEPASDLNQPSPPT